MKRLCVFLLTLAATTAPAAAINPGRVTLLCHRTANKDVPENTLESLEQAALLGCDVVEIDLRRTLDGRIVLNHDGVLERLTDGIGDLESTYYDDLRLRDTGSWMGERFSGYHIADFDDALRLARQRDIRLVLDIKTKGIGVEVLEALQREGMLQRVRFGGEWDDVKTLYPAASEDENTVWVQPGVTAGQVTAYHHAGKAVVANFSANSHEMELDSMKAAVAAGVDGINVDYPRLGAEAVGRPVEQTLSALVAKANAGESSARAAAILELARYRGFPLEDDFAHWLLDADDHVSRAAAIALVTARPRPHLETFSPALHSDHTAARANAAWALGVLAAPAELLLPLLHDPDPRVIQQTLLSLLRMMGDVSAETLLPLMSHPSPGVRGAAALALARHHPESALNPIRNQLRLEMDASIRLDGDYTRRGKPKLAQAEIDEITGYFRCEMKMLQAIAILPGANATQLLEEVSFGAPDDFLQTTRMVAGFQLWDRIATDPAAAVAMLASTDTQIADRAEWMLVQAGRAVLPEVRKALSNDNAAVRERAIRIVAWQGDTLSVDTLRGMTVDPTLTAWAIQKIESLHPKLQ